MKSAMLINVAPNTFIRTCIPTTRKQKQNFRPSMRLTTFLPILTNGKNMTSLEKIGRMQMHSTNKDKIGGKVKLRQADTTIWTSNNSMEWEEVFPVSLKNFLDMVRKGTALILEISEIWPA